MKKSVTAFFSLLLVLIFAMSMSITASADTVIIGDGGNEVVVPGGDSGESGGTGGSGTIIVLPSNGDDGDEDIPSSYEPEITKNPGAEKKQAGEDAVFIAHADNATSVTWYFVSGDTYYPAVEGPVHFEGLEVDGANSDTLYLSKIPESLNGWSVIAKFEGPGGVKWTASAGITVDPDPDATPTPEVSPSPEVNPVPTMTPQPIDGSQGGWVPDNPGTGSYYGTTGDDSGMPTSGDIQNLLADDVPAEEAPSEGRSHTLAYVLASIAGIAIVGICGTLVYMKKSGMSLGSTYDELVHGIDEDSFDEAYRENRNDNK